MRLNQDPITFTIFTEIKIIEQLAELRIQRVLPHDLQVSQFAVLNHFSNLGGEKTPAQLAKVFQVTKGAMTNTINRMEKQGLVRVRGDAVDRRRKLVSLTNKGLQVREEAAAAVAPVFADIASEFGRDRLANALPLLRDLRIFLSTT
ncbi:MAG: MarR family transcriptional regulator [Pseudomonadota bacterium]